MLSMVATSALLWFGAAGQPVAEIDETGPVSWDYVIVAYADRGEDFENAERVPTIFPRNGTSPGPLLECFNGRYRMAIGLKDTAFREMIPVNPRRSRRHTGVISVAGEETFRGPFFLYPEIQAVRSFERKPAAQVFNAVVRGQSATFTLRGKTYPLNLPPINDEFRRFAATCAALADGDEDAIENLTRPSEAPTADQAAQ